MSHKRRYAGGDDRRHEGYEQPLERSRDDNVGIQRQILEALVAQTQTLKETNQTLRSIDA